MEYRDLGRTGLRVSVAALGCGGHSKLGQRQGASVADSVRLVHEAVDLGINLIDTSDTGGIEEIVGQAVEDRRDSVLLATKLHTEHQKDGSRIDALELRSFVESSTARLRTDRIDVFYLHGVHPRDYRYCVDALVPELESLRGRGLVRFIGVTESWGSVVDLGHEMLTDAVADPYWDVFMTGFNMLNQSANRVVFPASIEKGIGVTVMYAVRDLLSRPDLLREAIRDAVADGSMELGGIDPADPFGFLVNGDEVASIVDAAYRFARDEPGVHSVMTGTGKSEHLRANVASLEREPLPREVHDRIVSLYGHLTCFTGNAKGVHVATERP